MGKPIRILHLDDSSSDATLVALTLEIEQKKLPTTIQYVQTKEEFIKALEQRDFDLILSDYRMPGFDGDQALAAAREKCPEIPFIMVTGELGEELVIETLHRGATDYVLKDRMFRLVPAIERALAEAENYRRRREAEREVQKRQGELWAIIQAMHGGVVVFDTEGNVVLINDALVSTLGYRDSSELKRNIASFAGIFEFWDTSGRLLLLKDWPASRILRGETVVNVELKGRRKDIGHEWFFSFSGQPVRDEKGKQILTVLVVRDITERKSAEEKLRQAQRTTSEILESIQDPFYSLDSEWRFTYINTKCEDFFQAHREEMLGRRLWDVIPDLSGTESARVLKAVAANRTPILFETRSLLRDAWVEVHVFPRADGGISVLYRDITERKAMEQALRTRESDLSHAQKAAHLGSWRWDLRNDSVTWSEELYRIFGVDPRTFVPSNAAVRELIHPEDRDTHATYVARALHGEAVVPFESRLIRPDGEECTVLASGFDVEFDETGEPVTMHGTILDITERKKAEGALHMSEERFSAAFRRSPYPQIISRVRDGVFVNVNDATLDLYGMERDEVIGHSSFELGLLPNPQERADLVAALARDGFVKDFPMRLTTRKKGERRLLLSASILSAGEEELMLTIVNDVTERKQAEEAFRQAAERYATLFSAISEGFAHYKAIYNAAGKLEDLLVVDINPAGARISGVEREAQIGRRWREIWPDVEDELFAVYEKVDRTEESFHFEHQSAITGGLYHCRVSKSGPGEFAVTFFDITDRRRMEDALREKEETLALAIEATGLGLFDYRPLTGQLDWNAMARKHFGLPPDSKIDYEVFLKGLHPEDRKAAHETIQAVLAPGSEGHYHVEYRTIGIEDGKERWLDARARVFFDEQGVAVRMLGATQDISANKSLTLALERRNRELEAERTKWEHLIEGIADEVWSCDVQGKMSLMNLVARPAMQLDEFAGKTINEVNEEVDILNADGTLRLAEDAPLLQALKGRIVRGEEIMQHRTTRITRFRQYSAVPVRDSEGNIVGSVAIVRDITQAKQAEMEARQAEQAVRLLNEELEERVQERTTALEAANKELEAFSYSVSHDLRSPLRLARGFADLLGRQTSLTEKQREALATIQTQMTHMDELITALLEFFRLTRKELRRAAVDTKLLVEEVVAEQRQALGEEAAKQVRIEIGDLPTVEADPILLRMVFTNLLSNAFKFTSTATDPMIRIEAKRTDSFYSFRIQDNGVGFPKGQTERLFRVFQRLHGVNEFEGTGIGLANVRKIVERHGGQVCGDGEEGKGATFFFTLPVSAHTGGASENRTSKLAV